MNIYDIPLTPLTDQESAMIVGGSPCGKLPGHAKAYGARRKFICNPGVVTVQVSQFSDVQPTDWAFQAFLIGGIGGAVTAF